MNTTEKRKQCIRYGMLATLNASIANEEYDCLQQLHEMTSISNAKLMQRFCESRTITQSPKNTLFTDLAYLIFKEAERNSDIVDVFSAVYGKRYSDLRDKIEKAEQMYLEGKVYDKLIPRTAEKYQSARGFFTIFLLLRSPVIDDISIYGFTIDQIHYAMECQLEKINNPFLDEHYKFDNDEPIFTSVAFQNYLKERRKELTDAARTHLELVVNNPADLGHRLEDILKSPSTDFKGFESRTAEGIVTGCARDLLYERTHSAIWYDQVTVNNPNWTLFTLRYTPNMDSLIAMYYRNVVKNECARYKSIHHKRLPSNHLDGSRVSGSALIDLMSVIYMYNLDVYCKLFTTSMEDYYRNFSWEKIGKKDFEQRHKKLLSVLEKQLADSAKQITKLKEQNNLLRKQANNRIGFDAIPFEQTIDKLHATIEERDSEIRALREQLTSRERYIELLTMADEPTNDTVIDVDVLRYKRYLFVGRVSEIAPQLYKDFPNSLFMENESFALQNIKVDGIVMLIKGMSHAMFYKVNATSSLDDVPVVRCNTRNIDTIYQAMFKLA